MEADKVTTENFVENINLTSMTFNILRESLNSRNKNENYRIITFYFIYRKCIKTINRCLEDNNNFLDAQYFVYKEHNFIVDDTKNRIRDLHEEKRSWNDLKNLRFKEMERLIKLITPIIVAMIVAVTTILKFY